MEDESWPRVWCRLVRVLFGSTIPETLDGFMRGQLAWIAAKGHEVHVVSSPGPALQRIATRERVTVHGLPMQREISLREDFPALFAWVRLVRRVRPDVIVVGTPKAGLLGGIAAWLTRVPRRVLLLRGARFEGSSGFRRGVLIGADWLSCRVAHEVIAVSPSLRALVVDSGIVADSKVRVPASGSSNGVDLVRFHPPSEEERQAARAALDLDPGQTAIVFVGRLHPDKGLDLLAESLKEMMCRESVALIVAGSAEGVSLRHLEIPGLRLFALGHVDGIQRVLHAADLLVLPTQREGFPNVVLEAAATGLPVITTNATGAVDSVIDGLTGCVVPKDDPHAMATALDRLVTDPALRKRMGTEARLLVEREFSNLRVWQAMYTEYFAGMADLRGGALSPRN